MPLHCFCRVRFHRLFLVLAPGVTAGVALIASAAGVNACAPTEPAGCAATGTCGPEGGGAGTAPDATQSDGPTLEGAVIIPWDAQDMLDGAACDPSKSPHDEPCVVDEAYGVFVASPASGGSDTSGDGSRTRPFGSIGHALTRLGGKRNLYICDGAYSESVTLQTAVSLYGGLGCLRGEAGAPWSYDQGTATLAGAQNQIPLTVTSTGPIAIEDMRIVAANASGHDDAGSGLSSVAVLVNGSTVAFRRCALNAGTGDNGVDGTSSANYAESIASAGEPNDGGTGGAGGIATCGDGTSSAGGAGGGAQSTNGGNGAARPMPAVTTPFDGVGAASGSATCGNGDPGANGAPNDAGAAASSYGRLSVSGWTPSMGGAGANGGPGQGGGGAGGKSRSSLGGTGGGAGGCGGAGGGGGGGGGASIALASTASIVTLDGCVLATSAAGSGGKGGNGQQGQGGGASPAVTGVCFGGFGGNGAGGAGGAGGTGGISVCVVYQGTMPSGSIACSHGSAGQPGGYGRGGDGGDNVPTQMNPAPGGPNGADGGPGISQDTLEAQ